MHSSLPCALLACVLLAGCTPEPPEKERPPEPKAAAVQAQAAPEADAVPADPLEQARAVQGTVDEASQREREAIEDSGG